MALNVPGRTITALSGFSPTYMIKKHYRNIAPLPQDWQEHFPDVSRQSDDFWILWKDIAED